MKKSSLQNKKEELANIVFETNTFWGKAFDLAVLALIIFSVLIVILESIPALQANFKKTFFITEWFITIVFLIEYLMRIWLSSKSIRYIISFWGIIDLLAILPAFVGLVYHGAHYLVIIRILRLLRVFRILKLVRYMGEAQILISALKASMYKITIFIGSVLSVILVTGALMYVVEGGRPGFHSIPHSMYWAIVTVTTVGFGDVVPSTNMGRVVASVMMLTGYAIIAVPTGIVTVELGRASGNQKMKSKFRVVLELTVKKDFLTSFDHYEMDALKRLQMLGGRLIERIRLSEKASNLGSTSELDNINKSDKSDKPKKLTHSHSSEKSHSSDNSDNSANFIREIHILGFDSKQHYENFLLTQQDYEGVRKKIISKSQVQTGESV